MQLRTIIDRIEIEPQTGNVGIRIRKQMIDETKVDPITGDNIVLASEYHRTMISPEMIPAIQINAVNTHLAKMGFPAIKTEDNTLLDSLISDSVLTALRTTKSEEIRLN